MRVSDAPPWQESPTPLPPPPLPDGTTTRMVVVVVVLVGAFYGITVLAGYGAFQYFAGKFSLGLFLAGSIWCVGFLLLRTANQAATESYDMRRNELRELHADSDGAVAMASRYDAMARRHEEITRIRSLSAALTLYGTACAGFAAATVMVNIGGFWALLDFLAVILFTGALLIHVVGPGEREFTPRLHSMLPSRWQ